MERTAHPDVTEAEAVAIAEEVATALWDLPEIEATFLTGSITKGQYDEHSDVDIGVLCPEAPSESDYLSAVETLDAENALREEAVFDAEVFVDGVVDPWGWIDHRGMRVEVRFLRRDVTRDRLEDVIVADALPDPDFFSSAFGRYPDFLAHSIDNCRIFHEEDDALTELKELLRPFPDVLQQRYVRDRLRNVNLLVDRLERQVRRGDFLFVHAMSARILRQLVIAIFGLNESYYPSDKWNGSFLDRFDHVPEGFERNLRRIRTLPRDSTENLLEIVAAYEGMIDAVETTADELGI